MSAKHATREAWLNDAATRLRPAFAKISAPLPERIRIAIGFPSTGSKGNRGGECWDASASNDNTFEILIRPDIDDPADVLNVLVHELVHAGVGLQHGHNARFRKIALAIGLVGKMKSTNLGPDCIRLLAPIMEKVGTFPHAKLNFQGLTTRKKKQTSRLIKCECEVCHYVARVARKWIDEMGAPHCPKHGEMYVDGDVNEEGEGE